MELSGLVLLHVTPEEAETVDVEVEDPELRRGTEDPDRWSSGVTDSGEIVTWAG